MKIGVTFPQTEIGPDPGGIREFVQAAEELDFAHLVVYDHVLGADPSVRPGWSGFYDKSHMFHEPMVLFGYLAAITQRLELFSGVLILGQRQTALVAKQAAEVDVLSGGRLRLGIGIGWNDVEYEALGQDFHNRGKRCEEQMAVLRALWTQEIVSFDGQWHTITAAGLNPLPVQRPIPLWIGGRAEAVIERTGRLADGWLPPVFLQAGDEAAEAFERLRGYAREAGRDPAAIGIEARVALSRATPEECARQTAQWERLGVSHVSINTMAAGFQSVGDHVEAIRRYREALGS